MKIFDVRVAERSGDMAIIRDAFRALVSYPNAGHVEADDPRQLVQFLENVCAALAHDGLAMPPSTCLALDLPRATASYHHGAQAAIVQLPRLARRFADTLDRRAGLVGAVAGRAS